jgi:hypothetical protein
MSVDEARKYLEIIAEKGFKWVLWTGGEVFIYYDEILDLTKYGKSLGLKFSIDTNAYWAISKTVAHEKLKPLKDAGVIHIDVSCDAFHMKYIPVDRVINAVESAQELGISSRVCFTYSGNQAEDNMILNKIKEEKLPYADSELAKVGFAKKLPESAFGCIDITKVGDCGELGPLVLPDGNVIGCCNPTVQKESPIFIGSGKDNLEKNLEKFLKSSCIMYLNTFGFKTLYEFLSGDSSFSQFKNKRYSHCCEFCEDIFSDYKLSAKLEDYMKKAVEAK